MARISGRGPLARTGPGQGTGTSPAGSAFYPRSIVYNGVTYFYTVFVPAAYDPTKPWPCIVNYEGNGTRGSDNSTQLNFGLPNFVKTSAVATFPAISIFLQEPLGAGLATLYSITISQALLIAKLALEATWREWNIDRTRIYVCGDSRGGTLAFALLCAFPRIWAAAAICSAPADPQTLDPYITTCSPLTILRAAQVVATIQPTLPIKAFLGDSDTTLPPLYPGYTMAQIASDMTNGLAANPNASVTVIAGGSHGGVFNNGAIDPTVLAWLMSQRR